VTAPVIDVRAHAVWRELVSSGALIRVLRWQPLAVAATAAIAIGVGGVVDGKLAVLRAAAVLLALGVAFVIDDASATTSAAVPVSRGYRLTMRIAVAGLSVGVAFAVAAVPERPVGASLLTGVALEATALGVIALAAGVFAHLRLDEPEPSMFGIGAVGAVVFSVLALSRRWPIMPSAGPDWRAAHVWWAGLLAVGVAALIAAGYEPGVRRGLFHRAQRRGE
jgi:fluoroquinolone transport system permease protein